ncbi:hypothetical protein D8N35_09040 [Enterococcus casseliflavus]|nr:hypothetical protein D8N35_09040 [Enterococcus casseliflavus]
MSSFILLRFNYLFHYSANVPAFELFSFDGQKIFLKSSIFSKKNKKTGSIIYGTDESELILQSHFHFRY